MKKQLETLEKRLLPFGGENRLNTGIIANFPEPFRNVYNYKIFGANLLAIPAEIIIEGDVDDFEKPFCFVNSPDTLELFEEEYRQFIPAEFIQIGNVFGQTEIVVMNTSTHTVHVFNAADVVDPQWLIHKLENELCDLNTLLANIRPQTVCCLLNPDDFSQYELFEIRDQVQLKTENEITQYETEAQCWNKYLNLVKNALNKGYTIHYAPAKLLLEING
jgi:hypothetical protein